MKKVLWEFDETYTIYTIKFGLIAYVVVKWLTI